MEISNIKKSKYKGFSLIELLLVITLISLTAVMTVPIGINYLYRNNQNIAKHQVTTALRSAQQHAREMKNDDAWGFHYGSGLLIVFKGTNYNTRDTRFDETYSIPSFVSISGTNDIVFAKQTGKPPASSTLSVQGRTTSTTVTINSSGMIAR